MTDSVLAFDLAIDRFLTEDIPEEVGKITRVIATEALRKVVLKSPVDKGRFRGGWVVSVDQRIYEAPPEVTGVKSGAPGREARAAAAAAASINAGLGVIAGVQPFQNVILQNNVEYGPKLEEGGSDQAPQGIVAITVAELELLLP